MPPLTLFDSTAALLDDDERGRIACTPGFVDAATAHAWFTELRREVRWRAEQRTMYDREVDVPRLIAHFRLHPPSGSVPAAILDAARHVTEHVEAPFNSVGLNLYRDAATDNPGGDVYRWQRRVEWCRRWEAASAASPLRRQS